MWAWANQAETVAWQSTPAQIVLHASVIASEVEGQHPLFGDEYQAQS
jgi:hypothetical protein